MNEKRPPGPIRRSLAAHLRRPMIMLLVVGGSVLMFTFGRLTGDRQPDASDLARAYGAAPLDAFADIGIIDAQLLHWRTPVVLAGRVLLVAYVLSLLLRVKVRRRDLLRLAAVYTGALVSVAIPLGIALGTLKLADAEATGLESAGVLAALVILPLALTLLTAFWAPMAARAIAGQRLRPLLNRPSIWLLAALCTWFYLFTSNRIDALDRGDAGGSAPFLVALLVIAAQSVLYGAIALESTRTPLSPEPAVDPVGQEAPSDVESGRSDPWRV